MRYVPNFDNVFLTQTVQPLRILYCCECIKNLFNALMRCGFRVGSVEIGFYQLCNPV